uniref:Lysozyme n=1 Tax=Acrobeloides nanus TaxID=290746 RepID=A0A914CLK3_9BILA
MYRVAFILLGLSSNLVAQNINGVDTGPAAISTTVAQCLLQNGYKLFAGRIGKTTGTVDNVGITNIQNALAAGIPYVHAYIMPNAQHDAATQVQNALNALGSTKVNVLWLDIENSQYQQWSTDTSTNQQFFVDLWNAAVPYAGKSFDYLGVYSFKTQWDPVMGDTFNAGLPATTPIWWARYNSNTDPCGGWENFALWQNGCPSFAIHQYCCLTTKNICGVGPFDTSTAAWAGWQDFRNTSQISRARI